MSNKSNYFSRTPQSKDNWETPPSFFRSLNSIFHFTLDACATKENTKCNKYYTKEQNGLLQNWANERVFVNPPFKEKQVWIKKAYIEAQKDNTIVVMILPPRTDTKIWHEYVMKAKEIWLCVGRINFLFNGEKIKNSSTFPLTVIIFEKNEQNVPKLKSFYWK